MLASGGRSKKGGKQIVKPARGQKGTTTLVLDTNVLLVGQGIDGYVNDGGVLAAATGWEVIVPLVVVTELDGLRSSPSPSVARSAKSALSQLSKSLHAREVRVQTSRGNFLADPDLNVRNEQIEFAGTIPARSLDDVILRTAVWQTSSGPVSSDEAPGALLVTLDTNLRLKARAYGVAAATPKEVLAMLRKG